VHLPQLMNPLQTSFDALVKFGYSLPFLARRLQVFVDFGYTQPEVTVKGGDARVPGSSFSSTTIVRDFAPTLGAQFFILEPSKVLVPYVSAGMRVHFLLAETKGSAGDAEFGQYVENDTRVGGVFAVGAGYRFGPGRVLLELALNVLPVDQRLTGASNASSLSIVAGYGLLF
jgi:outer membrane protein W